MTSDERPLDKRRCEARGSSASKIPHKAAWQQGEYQIQENKLIEEIAHRAVDSVEISEGQRYETYSWVANVRKWDHGQREDMMLVSKGQMVLILNTWAIWLHIFV